MEKISKILTQKEKRIIYIMVGLILVSSLFLLGRYWLKSTKVVPAPGGEYIEGVVGLPRFVNPILAQTNDIDMDLSRLIFSSLVKIDSQGNLVSELARKYEIDQDQKTYTFFLKKDVFWHDGEPLNASDVVFTVQAIQDPRYKSPLRTKLQGVEVEKIDDYTVQFKLKDVYAPFLYNLDFGILPKHIWEYIPSEFIELAEYNLKPIGSGPFRFLKLKKDKKGEIKSFHLEKFKDYYGKAPYIERIIFKFYPSEELLISAYNKKEVLGIAGISPKNLKKIKAKNNFNLSELSTTQYFAVFFNQTKSKPLADKTVRLALAYATDKEKIIQEIFDGRARNINSPILPGMLGFTQDTKVYDFAPEHAKNILEAEGWKDTDGDGVREKQEVRLEIELVVSEWPELKNSAEILAKQWERIGVLPHLKVLGISEIQQNYIRPREYEALLFGQSLGLDPDPFAFWYSLQRKDPGLNLAMYTNKEVDKLLEEARLTLDKSIRIKNYEEFQKKLTEDIPAIFLYSPSYLYLVSKAVKQEMPPLIANSSQRFAGVEEWYIKTKRVWK